MATAGQSLTGKASIRNIEQAFQRALNIDHAIWLPSARYGITHAISTSLPSNGIVACPVFNCGAVFHAAGECNRQVQFIDCAKNSFLAQLTATPQRSTAIILSEMFGQRFSVDDLQQPLAKDAALRIFDMAMAIPRPADMPRMRQSDVAVISFGLGKSLYAGWGGMAFTQCPETARTLRRQRDQDLQHAGLLARLKWNFQLAARTLAHEPLMYKRLREIKQRQPQNPDNKDLDFNRQSHEWHRPPTSLSTSRTLNNLQLAETFSAKRIQLSEEYSHQLRDVAECLRLPPNTGSAMSHYSIRVSAHVRESLRQQLWCSGIDVGSLFPFPHQVCDAADFPNAEQAAQEVLNLPLSNQLSTFDVTQICDCIKHSLQSSANLDNQQHAA